MNRYSAKRLIAEICRFLAFAILLSMIVSFVIVGDNYSFYGEHYAVYFAAFGLSFALVVLSYILCPQLLHPFFFNKDSKK